MSNEFELILPADFDERAEYEAEQRGLLDYVKLRFAVGPTYSLCFFTPSRIAIELDLIRQAGEACFAVPGLIVIPAITKHEMASAVGFLVAAGYFDKMRADQ